MVRRELILCVVVAMARMLLACSLQGCDSSQCVTVGSSTCCMQCQEGFFKINGCECYQCVSNCLQCTSATTCSTCKSSYRLDSSSTCVQCGSNCLACDTNACTQCAEGFSLSQGQCSANTSSKSLIGQIIGYTVSGVVCILCCIVTLLYQRHKAKLEEERLRAERANNNKAKVAPLAASAISTTREPINYDIKASTSPLQKSTRKASGKEPIQDSLLSTEPRRETMLPPTVLASPISKTPNAMSKRKASGRQSFSIVQASKDATPQGTTPPADPSRLSRTPLAFNASPQATISPTLIPQAENFSDAVQHHTASPPARLRYSAVFKRAKNKAVIANHLIKVGMQGNAKNLQKNKAGG